MVSSMWDKRIIILILAIFVISGIVSAASEYCDPQEGITTTIVTSGAWTNITILSDGCPVCVETAIGLQCSLCEQPTPTPTPTPSPSPTPTYSPTPTPEPTPCVPAPGVWCPLPTATPAAPPCFLFWCPIPTPSPTPTPTPTPSPYPTPTICGNGVWCPI